MAALFPGYVGELASAAMVSRSIDETIERRTSCAEEPIRRYLTTDPVVVEDEYSDTQLAELFLHHRVLIIRDREGRVAVHRPAEDAVELPPAQELLPRDPRAPLRRAGSQVWGDMGVGAATGVRFSAAATLVEDYGD